MKTPYIITAKNLWNKFGRIDSRGRIYLANDYLGRSGTDDQGQPFTFAKGERHVGYIGIEPIAIVASHLME